MNFFDKTDDEIIALLATGNNDAIDVLKRVPTPPQLRLLALDLFDMEMSGEQIFAAYGYCAESIDELIMHCATRDEKMLAFVNMTVPARKARRGAPSTASPQIDQAIKAILTEAEQAGNLTRLDEASEAVNKFFIAALTQMQKYKDFTGNLRINIGGLVEGASFAQFKITLTGLVGYDGNLLSVEQQPTAENQRISEAIATKAVEEGIDKALKGLGAQNSDETPSVDMTDTATRIMYMLAIHETAVKRMAHPDFKDPFADWRWSYAVTLKEMASFVDSMLANGTEIDPRQVADFKAGRAFIRMNDIRVVPELEDSMPAQTLNG